MDGSPTTACLNPRGGARASKGAYTFHRSQMGFCELYGMQLGPLRLAVEAGLNLAFVGVCQFLASYLYFGPKINKCSYFSLVLDSSAWRNLLLANSIAPRLKVFTDGRSAAGRDLYPG